jgi:hypothetical protein
MAILLVIMWPNMSESLGLLAAGVPSRPGPVRVPSTASGHAGSEALTVVHGGGRMLQPVACLPLGQSSVPTGSGRHASVDVSVALVASKSA